MRYESGRDVIRVRGARQNNLKGFDLDIPTHRLIVVTGLSGSGKSSLAFDTLYAEGQRRYIETFSPYARQFFDRMDKPRVDAIEGIPPAIALEQRNSVRTTRSTVGTMTEICDHMKVLWPHLARLHCRQCGRPVMKESPREVWEQLRNESEGSANTRSPETTEVLVTFSVSLSVKLDIAEQLGLIARQGFQRLLLEGEVVRVDAALARITGERTSLNVIQDRVKLAPAQRARFVEACEQAYHFGHGKLCIVTSRTDTDAAVKWDVSRFFSKRLHCATCDIEYPEPAAALFSFNNPVGACPTCKGFGRIIAIDYDLAIPDRSKTLAEGAVKPWQSGMSADCQADLTRAAKQAGVPLDVPFRELSPEHQRWVIEGDPDYGEGNEWPRAWYGVKGYFRWLESKVYKMHVRVLLSRYRAYRTCGECKGQRLQPGALLWRLPLEFPDGSTRFAGQATDRKGLSIADFYALPVDQALRVIQNLSLRNRAAANDPIALALSEVKARLDYLVEVGVGYLTLDRPTRTLSGGETQRVNLTTCLGTRLVNTLFVLDEPSIGLHARDAERLVGVLTRLRDLGNTVVVVEHEVAMMKAADQIIDLGPGHGDAGGDVVVQGDYKAVTRHPRSLTGAYLSGRQRIEVPSRRRVMLRNSTGEQAVQPDAAVGMGDRRSASVLSDQSVAYRGGSLSAVEEPPALVLRGITRNNLRGLEVEIPLNRFVCLSGVSGSGKTTLASELLYLLRQELGSAVSSGGLGVREAEHEEDNSEGEGDAVEADRFSEVARLEGARHLGAVLLVDQSPIGRTPRSNPAVYTGAFDYIRELFSQTTAAHQRRLGPSAFSFNSPQGQCEQCRGAGFEKIEMQFLSDVFIRCSACEGRRYRPHILEVKVRRAPEAVSPDGLSIADVLELTIDDAISFLDAQKNVYAAAQARDRLRVVQDVGLGYLRLGQPVNTLSGGESQRLKLAGHLAPVVSERRYERSERSRSVEKAGLVRGPTLFVFDEPTTGLHLEDVRVLLAVFQRLVQRGDSVLIIEHHLEVLKSADWIIDLGPDAGEQGGRIVVAGTPEDVAACGQSYTGRALRDVLGTGASGTSTNLRSPLAGTS